MSKNQFSAILMKPSNQICFTISNILFCSSLGMSCLHLAMISGQTDIVHHLLEFCGANINAEVRNHMQIIRDSTTDIFC